MVERQSLSSHNNVRILRNNGVDLRGYRTIIDKHRNGADSLFHQFLLLDQVYYSDKKITQDLRSQMTRQKYKKISSKIA
jgi:hypothetical protein